MGCHILWLNYTRVGLLRIVFLMLHVHMYNTHVHILVLMEDSFLILV